MGWSPVRRLWRGRWRPELGTWTEKARSEATGRQSLWGEGKEVRTRL